MSDFLNLTLCLRIVRLDSLVPYFAKTKCIGGSDLIFLAADKASDKFNFNVRLVYRTSLT